MARRSTPPAVDLESQPTLRLDNGVCVRVGLGEADDGDPIEAHVGDDLIGAAKLRVERRGDMLSGRIALRDIPVLTFPARARVVNARTGAEIGSGVDFIDTSALIAAAGRPNVDASFIGFSNVGPMFSVTLDRLARYGRAFSLRLGDQHAATAISVPDETSAAQTVCFGGVGLPAPDATFAVVETVFGDTAISGRFDASTMLAAALPQLARLQDEVVDLRRNNSFLRQRLDTALDLGREKLLLERLDLFYLLLSERLDRATAVVRRPPDTSEVPDARVFGPADIDGIGIFEVETDGVGEWRWFGPDATIALRDIPWPPGRVVLYFHGFGDTTEPPVVRVSTGGPTRTARVRLQDGRFAVDIPLPGDAMAYDGMVVVHVAFDRHQTSEADPRLLSAVFSGAEVIALLPK